MGVGGDIGAAGNMAADVIAVSDIDDGCRGVFVFEKRCERFPGDAWEGADVEFGG